jgi:hypothetical protein
MAPGLEEPTEESLTSLTVHLMVENPPPCFSGPHTGRCRALVIQPRRKETRCERLPPRIWPQHLESLFLESLFMLHSLLRMSWSTLWFLPSISSTPTHTSTPTPTMIGWPSSHSPGFFSPLDLKEPGMHCGPPAISTAPYKASKTTTSFCLAGLNKTTWCGRWWPLD